MVTSHNRHNRYGDFQFGSRNERKFANKSERIVRVREIFELDDRLPSLKGG
jgi:hypothetical protein